MDQKSVVERSFCGEPPPCIVFLQFGRQCLGQFFQIEQIVIVDAPNAKARFFYQAIGVTGLDTALVLGAPANSSGPLFDLVWSHFWLAPQSSQPGIEQAACML